MSAATVSVVIPARNAERYLAEAIGSVLEQSPPPAELIVVDDGSTDATADLATGADPAIVVLRTAGAGRSAAANLGIKRSRGELIAFLDADDVWTQDKLAIQLEALSSDPGLDMVFGHARPFVSPDLSRAEAAALLAPAEPGPFRARSTMLARRDVFERVGGFDRDLQVGEFVAWYGRAVAAGVRDRMLEQVVLKRRLHATNSTRGNPEALADYARAVRIALEARGGTGAGEAGR